MFCTQCNMSRPADWNTCPHCGAPSPWMASSQVGGTDAGQVSFVEQEEFPQQQQQQQSFLPVPYRGQGQQGQINNFAMPGTQLQTIQQEFQIQLPPQEQALAPLQGQESIVYVPPMYTKPRPIIPRYRIISGLLSLIIVSLLMCTGAGYYAKASGQLTRIQQVIGGMPPTNLTPAATANLPDPPINPILGPAYNVIPSAVMTAHTDPTNPYFAREQENKFTVGQLIHLIYSIQKPPKAGYVKTVWYTNGHYYGTATNQTIIPAGSTQTGDSQMKYMRPAEGKVELYWNNQLAWTLFFVVRPQ